MDAELKAKWVKALRSGEYEQGRGHLLTTDNKHCCLGVLCAIQGVHLIEWPLVSLKTTQLPSHLNGGLAPHQTRRLATMNDGMGEFGGSPKSFAEIADYIEREL